jgi:hypothetical protein
MFGVAYSFSAGFGFCVVVWFSSGCLCVCRAVLAETRKATWKLWHAWKEVELCWLVLTCCSADLPYPPPPMYNVTEGLNQLVL